MSILDPFFLGEVTCGLCDLMNFKLMALIVLDCVTLLLLVLLERVAIFPAINMSSMGVGWSVW